MIIDSIKLINFRNYENISCSFSRGINFIYGNNATGKTSLVEGIYYLSLARSFRTSDDSNLINRKSDFASIFAQITIGEAKKKISVYLTREGKKIAINEKQIHKISELNSLVNCIYFIPKDVNLLKDSPKGRRLFLDLSISKVSKSYLEHVTNYERLLKERNLALKSNSPNLELIEVLTGQMISISKEIYLYRKEYIEELNKIINTVFKEISKTNDKLQIIYVPFVNNTDNYKELAEKEYKNSLELDLKKKQTQKGIQHEDFYLLENNKNIGTFGSQGENRIAVLALKLSPYWLIKETKSKPIVILDDVLSELDESHQTNLINYLQKFIQVFITSTKKEEFLKINYYKVENNTVRKEE